MKHVKKTPKETDPNEPDKGSAEPLSRNLGSHSSIGKHTRAIFFPIWFMCVGELKQSLGKCRVEMFEDYWHKRQQRLFVALCYRHWAELSYSLDNKTHSRLDTLLPDEWTVGDIPLSTLYLSFFFYMENVDASRREKWSRPNSARQ